MSETACETCRFVHGADFVGMPEGRLRAQASAHGWVVAVESDGAVTASADGGWLLRFWVEDGLVVRAVNASTYEPLGRITNGESTLGRGCGEPFVTAGWSFKCNQREGHGGQHRFEDGKGSTFLDTTPREPDCADCEAVPGQRHAASCEVPEVVLPALVARLRAFGRECVVHGDMTPAAERMLLWILDEAGA